MTNQQLTIQMLTLQDLPLLNALLNATSALFLLAGYALIRWGKVRPHATFMLAAVATSVAFLTSYLILHYHVGSTRFPPLGWVRTGYLLVLLTHTVLAAVLPLLVVLSLFFAVRRQWQRHRRIAIWTFPIWLYVSFTGVTIYWMLYHLAPTMHP